MPDYAYLTVIKDGGAINTQVQQVLETAYISQLNLIFEAVTGGPFASEIFDVEVSVDNTNWILVDDNVSLGTGSIFGKFYDRANRCATVGINPASFPFVRITVPAIATKRVKLTYAGKGG